MFVCKDAVFLLETYQNSVETDFFCYFSKNNINLRVPLKTLLKPIPQTTVLDNNAVPE